jgi:hypothetical protein
VRRNKKMRYIFALEFPYLVCLGKTTVRSLSRRLVGVARISQTIDALRRVNEPTEKEKGAGRCGTSAKPFDARCRLVHPARREHDHVGCQSSDMIVFSLH